MIHNLTTYPQSQANYGNDFSLQQNEDEVMEGYHVSDNEDDPDEIYDSEIDNHDETYNDNDDSDDDDEDDDQNEEDDDDDNNDEFDFELQQNLSPPQIPVLLPAQAPSRPLQPQLPAAHLVPPLPLAQSLPPSTPTTVPAAPVVVKDSQGDLRKLIIQIQQDAGISAHEKAKRIQELMTSKWSSRENGKSSRTSMASNKLEDKRHDFGVVLNCDKSMTFHDSSNTIIGCKHYQRAAKLQAHCCGKWYTCRFCHDEVSDHNIIRNLITTMMCMHCFAVQPAGQDCINPDCQKRVSKYFCKDCKLWDDDPRKNIYHCHDCGICRIGKGLGQDYFHCQKCNVCMAMSLKGRHKCIERNLESDCPICGEYMFTSTTTVIFMPCGHCIHYKCHQEYIQTSYQCPTCFKSLANMTEYFKRIDAMLSQHQMPPEYTNTQTFIYCNDCEKKSFAKFHFLYHRCLHCKGYNTKVLQTMELNDGMTVESNNAELLLKEASKTLPEIEPKEVVAACCRTDAAAFTSPISQNSSTSSNHSVAPQRSVSSFIPSQPLLASSSSIGAPLVHPNNRHSGALRTLQSLHPFIRQQEQQTTPGAGSSNSSQQRLLTHSPQFPISQSNNNGDGIFQDNGRIGRFPSQSSFGSFRTVPEQQQQQQHQHQNANFILGSSESPPTTSTISHFPTGNSSQHPY
ncbi:hypothetical protein HK100_004390 [Physocladia obscura]|uniref:Zf-CHY-domain-containing protein n=1 Tax=Physocladia obscura TaxID=109957 RepID=A0AAD5SYK9_9FUNG|nr:hypothetical protein HK100_004390 [Physocladia obscura]